jgi:hypoxanthine phosphoribosyltransferase
MKSVYELIKSRNPNSLKTCALLDKPSRRKVEFECDYVGFTIDDLFIVGYGLNYGDYYRNVDHIFIFLQEDEE